MSIPIKKSSAAPAPVESEPSTDLSQEQQIQIVNNTKLDTTDYTSTETEEKKAKRADDVVQLKFSKGKRLEAKVFFTQYDLKMNAGFEMAYEYLKSEVEAGNVRLSKSGVQKIKKQQ